MAESTKNRLQAPGGSWESIKKIIRAYHAVEDNENPTVEDVAKIAGVQRPVVSSNNNFLRSVGILQDNANKLSDVGSRLATGLSVGNQSLVTGALEEVVRSQEGLKYLVGLVRARSNMSVEAFRGEIIMLCGLGADSRNLLFIKTVIDMLQESSIIKVEDDEVIFRGFYVQEMTGVAAKPIPTKSEERNNGGRPVEANIRTLPIALGVGRLVHVELPEDWSPKDLPKLLKMLELSLSEFEGVPK
jgi:hypothetical protein